MTGWFLFLVIMGSLDRPSIEATDIKQFGPFTTREACQQVGRLFEGQFSLKYDKGKKIVGQTEAYCIKHDGTQ